MSGLVGWTRVARLQNTGTYFVRTSMVRRVARLQKTGSRYDRTGRMEQSSTTAKYWHTPNKQGDAKQQDCKILAHTLCKDWHDEA